jgi:mannose-1-phosphate guanylyltransferase
MNLNRIHAVIMAGGGGTRLWPLSRLSKPKQSIPLLEGKTLFQMAVERLAPDLPTGNILVVTVPAYAELLEEQVERLEQSNFLVEPKPRGTAAALGYAAIVLHSRDPEAIMACLTADHIIRNEERFRELLDAAQVLAEQGHLVTLGITPNGPSTAYGYIQVGSEVGLAGDFRAHQVLQFNEKPALEQAKQYFESGEYCWNSGMFVWRADRILAEIKRLMPELSAGLAEISAALGTAHEAEAVARVWDRLEPQTIDYGVMEKASEVVVIPADDLEWQDVGGWDRLSQLAETDPDGNLLVLPNALVMKTRDSLVYQAAGEKARLIAALGIEELVVVDTDDVLLICHRDHAEEVRSLVARLSEMGMEKYL